MSEELAGIDIELDKAMEALSETNHRIDSFLNDDAPIPERIAAELPEDDESPVETNDVTDAESSVAEESAPDSDDASVDEHPKLE